ncbi:DUF2007 domain-containing protein [Agaribacterium haliotis]|uniref:putative signal transducing protein n=1 Tax=Agaribacterium haliotis TaxID=2013869 RepID=UPI000BB55F45|nr:DUF2007 domain-containing protein [Agaribacterium haliotis]
MKLLFTHENSIIVENAKNCLREAGIDCLLKNEFSSGAVGELAAIETWPELWVHEREFDRARHIVEALTAKSERRSWLCQSCSEENDASFDHCWNCQRDNGGEL